MILKTTKLRDAICFALVVGATTALSMGTALAQDTTTTSANPSATTPTKASAAASDPANLDTIVVTGTRIQSQTVTASSPVAEIQKEEFQYAGATRTEDLVNQYPQLTPAFDSFTNNGALGYPSVDLRGLGSSRTLVLVDGNRLQLGANESRDISIIPAALIKRVDILTGGASAVYGSDAIAGVVNFILDTDFEGVSFTAGYSAYRHNNNNDYIQGKEAARGFIYPSGDSGFDGTSKNIDIAIGSSFADGAGHAMAWITWRQNDALFQGERDYSSCALNAAGTRCGGSATNATGDFYVYQLDGEGNVANSSSGGLLPDGHFANSYGAPYNYAPINYYQRPDQRYTFGTSVKYEVNDHFKPYVETMFLNRKSSVQVAESGAFFTGPLEFACDNPIISSLCGDLGFDPELGPVNVYVARRNIEGGPRRTDTETNSFRLVAGAEGAISDTWSYNASVLYGHTGTDTEGFNDLLTDRIAQAINGCPAGSFTGCLPYNVFYPGGVTAAAATALSGVSSNKTATELKQFNAYVTGDVGFGIGSADNIKLVVGTEWREENLTSVSDTNSQEGNFAGSGGKSAPVAGGTRVKEAFMEAAIPLVKDWGFVKSFDVDLGYRVSDYELSGKADTYKIGFTTDLGMFRVRGGYNRAIRAPSIGDLFSAQTVQLYGGDDPCGGPTPEFTAAQCLRTGVSAAQYGHVPTNPAGQNNQFVGGNLNLTPEKADTYTLGFVVTPIKSLQVSLDYYDIKLTDTITTIGADTILRSCGLTGNATLCSFVHRNPLGGDLFRGQVGFVQNLGSNFGNYHFRGLDLGASYGWDMFGGRFSSGLQGTYVLKQEITPLPGVDETASYRCEGNLSPACGSSPKWRHIANVRYARDIWSVNLRWRYFGKVDYQNTKFDGNGFVDTPIFTDKLICDHAANAACLGNGGIASQSYLDLSGTVALGDDAEVTMGVNNIADKEPPLTGNTLATNGNAPGGYDPAGRFFFASVTFKF